MWFMILSTRYENNPKATVWNGSEKFMSLWKHLLQSFTVAFEDILPNNGKLVLSIW